jgi:hypothetical protein
MLSTARKSTNVRTIKLPAGRQLGGLPDSDFWATLEDDENDEFASDAGQLAASSGMTTVAESKLTFWGMPGQATTFPRSSCRAVTTLRSTEISSVNAGTVAYATQHEAIQAIRDAVTNISKALISFPGYRPMTTLLSAEAVPGFNVDIVAYSAHHGLVHDAVSKLSGRLIPYTERLLPENVTFPRIASRLDPNTSTTLWADFVEVHQPITNGRPGTTALQEPDLTARIAHRLAQIPAIIRAVDSVLPSREVIDATQRISGYLPVGTVLPQIEVDDSTGSLSLVWRDRLHRNAFSLEITNSDFVVGVGVGPKFSRFKPWRHPISNERKIVAEFESSPTTRELLSGA